MDNNPLALDSVISALRNTTYRRLILTFICLVFGAFGLVFMVTSLNDYQQRLATRHWVATTCEIVESSIADDGWWYRFNVVFNYRFNGRDRTGRDFTHKRRLKMCRIDDVQRTLEQYPRGTITTCYANPLIPDEALILRDLSMHSLIKRLLLLLPLTILSFRMLFVVWRHEQPEPPPTSPPTGGKAPRGTLAAFIIFGSVYLLAGLVFTCQNFEGTILKQRAARAWTPVKAVVRNSAVRVRPDQYCATYTVAISYCYQIDGREYRGERYAFRNDVGFSYDAKQQVVTAHRPGSTIRIYVNPADPNDSVIVRDMGAALYYGLLPLVFSVIGALIIALGIKVCR